MSRSNTAAPKSIPVSEIICEILDLNDHGTTGAVTSQGVDVFDLQDEAVAVYHEGLAKIEVSTTNGQGATPTSPGAAATLTLHYAFLGTLPIKNGLPMTVAQIESSNVGATMCQEIDNTLVITFPNSSSSGTAGHRIWSTEPFVISGRYLVVWYDRDAFAANALVDVIANLIRL